MMNKEYIFQSIYLERGGNFFEESEFYGQFLGYES